MQVSFRSGFRLLILAGFLLLPAGTGVTQTDGTSEIAADTTSPRSTLQSFIDACNELHQMIQDAEFIDRGNAEHLPLVERIVDCLDNRDLPAFARRERTAEVAICIKEILDRVSLPNWDNIPGREDVESPEAGDRFLRWRIPGTRLTIARIEDGPQKHEYLFTSGTVDRAVDYYRSIAHRPYRTDGPAISQGFYKWYMSAPGHPFVARIVRQLPDNMRFGRTFGLTNWKWPGLLLLSLLSVGLLIVIYRFDIALKQRFRGTNTLAYCLTIILPTAAVLVPMLYRHIADDYLTVRGNALYFVSFAASTISILAGVVLVFAAFDRIGELIIASPRVNPKGLNAQLIRIASKLGSVAFSTAVLLFGGQYLGIPIATLLASAGVGGIALALGAQDALKTLFGTIMLMGDKPFRVGERIIFKGYDGIVEDIGLRSTRIRLLNGHQASVPNDELARSDIENVGRRNHIRRVFNIHIPLDTDCEKIEKAVEIVRRKIANHEGMHDDRPPRVNLVEMGPDAFVIRVFYWYHPASYWEYLDFSERFNLAVFREFTANGIDFSLPQRVAHASFENEPCPFDVRMLPDKEN